MVRVYLDNCCFNRPFDDQSQLRVRLETEAKLRIQEYVLAKKVELVWSYILAYENTANPFAERRLAIANWDEEATVSVTQSDTLVEKATEVSELGIRNKDALHISCAIQANCDYFITTDDKLLNKADFINELAVTDPIGFIKEFE